MATKPGLTHRFCYSAISNVNAALHLAHMAFGFRLYKDLRHCQSLHSSVIFSSQGLGTSTALSAQKCHGSRSQESCVTTFLTRRVILCTTGGWLCIDIQQPGLYAAVSNFQG